MDDVMATLPVEKIIRYESEDGIHVKAMEVGELVRCKDCKYRKVFYHGGVTFSENCGLIQSDFGEEGFCAYGERREE